MFRPFRLNRALIIVLLTSSCLNAAGIRWGLPSLLGWAPDELTPVRVMSGARMHFASGWHDAYPALHFYLLSVLYAPLLIADSEALEIGSPTQERWRRSAGDGSNHALFLIGRSVSVLMSIGILLCVNFIAAELLGCRAGPWAAGVMALSLPFVYYAKVANVDVPFTFWFALALAAYVVALRTGQTSGWILFGACAALAICTKDQAYGLFVIPWTVLLVTGRRQGALLTLIAGVVVFLFASGVLWNYSGFIAHLRVTAGPTNLSMQMFERSPLGYLRLLWLSGRLISFGLGPFVLFALVGLALMWRQRLTLAMQVVLWPCVSYLLFFLAPSMVAYDRYFLPVFVCLSVPAGFAAAELCSRARGRRRWQLLATAACTFIFGWAAVRVVAVDLAMIRDPRYAVEQWLLEHVPTGASVQVVGGLTQLPRLSAYRWVQRVRARDMPPEFVVATNASDDNPRAFLNALAAETRGAEVVLHLRSKVPWALNVKFWTHPVRHLTNLSKLNPSVVVLRRGGRDQSS